MAAKAAASTAMNFKIKMFKAGSEQQKTVQLEPDSTVKSALVNLGSKFGESGKDWGLFLPPTPNRRSKWMEENKTLGFYDLRDGDVIELRVRYRPQRVRLPDQSYKAIMIDENMTVAQLVFLIAEKAGILSNPEEYSLKLDVQTGVSWLLPSRTLRDQNVSETQAVVFARRLHFTQIDVSMDNPRELHILYEQNRDSVVSGEHIMNEEQAVGIGAWGLQVARGDFTPGAAIDLLTVLPPVFNNKKVAAAVTAKYQTQAGTAVDVAKFRYVSACKQLPSYGVTFFRVSEYVPAKKQNRELFLGVTKEKIMKMDVETKQVLEEWPLSHVARFAASTSTFTLDLGEYRDGFISFNTGEGEGIKHVLEGYRNYLAGLMPEVHTGVTVDRSQTTGMEAEAEKADPNEKWKPEFEKVEILERGDVGEVVVEKASKKKLATAGLAVLGNEMEEAAKAMAKATDEMTAHSNFGVAIDEETRARALPTVRSALTNVVTDVAVSSARVILLTVILNAAAFDRDSLSFGVKDLGESGANLSKSMRALASMSEESIGRMTIDAGIMVSNACRRLIAAATNATAEFTTGQVSQPMREEILMATQAIGASVVELLARAEASEVEKDQYDLLQDHLNKVANSVTRVIAAVKIISDAFPETMQASKARMSNSAVGVWLSITQLSATVKVCAPAINKPQALESLVVSCRVVGNACDALQAVTGAVGVDERPLGVLAGEVSGVHDALARLVLVATTIGQAPNFEDLMATGNRKVLEGTKAINASLRNPMELLRNAKLTGIAIQDIIKALTQQADLEDDPELRQRLLDAARMLGDATGAMVLAARSAAGASGDANKANELLKATMALDSIMQRMMLDLSLIDDEGARPMDFTTDALVAATRALGGDLTSLVTAASSTTSLIGRKFH